MIPRNSNLSKTFSTSIKGNKTDFSIMEFSNRTFILITQCRKIGNLFTVSLDSPQQRNGGMHPQGLPIYNIKCIFGENPEELTVAIRSLSEKIIISKSLLISLTIPNLDYETISNVADAIIANRA